MSNRLLIFEVPFAEFGFAVDRATLQRKEDDEEGGWRLGVGRRNRADNTINLLPRIVKLRWNFKLDILSENLTVCPATFALSPTLNPLLPGSFPFPWSPSRVFPSFCSFARDPSVLFFGTPWSARHSRNVPIERAVRSLLSVAFLPSFLMAVCQKGGRENVIAGRVTGFNSCRHGGNLRLLLDKGLL